MAKNIVICCDGTGNEYGDANSNVIKLYNVLKLENKNVQIAYYHPGVGTMGAKSALTVIGKWWTKVRGLAFGYGLSENIADAYQYLMRNYEPGDNIYIFGFSRGAYTARALCGLLQMFGLLASGNEGLIPYAIRLFKRNDKSFLRKIARVFSVPQNKFRTAEGFKKTFCNATECKPHFLGVWDTVSSVGMILDPFRRGAGLPYTFDLGEVETVRHAVSIDERRAFFRQNLAKGGIEVDKVKQVWFPGVHSDVGGSYPESESGLSKISLRWMLREAKNKGLLVDGRRVADTLGEDLYCAPPSANAMMHNSMKIGWWLGEFWPKRGFRLPNFFRLRTIPENSYIHQSALDRKRLLPEYKLKNLPAAYKVEDQSTPQLYPVHLDVQQQWRVGIHAGLKWNDTTLNVRKGERYHFEASGSWYDATIRTDPDGYGSPSFWFRLLERFRRSPKADWFKLIGVIGKDQSTAFEIGVQATINISSNGILQCFANDLSFMYGNNSGVVKLVITRMADQDEKAVGTSASA